MFFTEETSNVYTVVLVPPFTAAICRNDGCGSLSVRSLTRDAGGAAGRHGCRRLVLQSYIALFSL